MAIYHRARPRLKARVEAAGAGAVPALLLLGLAAAGEDLAELEQEVAAALAGDLAPHVAAALRRLFVGDTPASTPQAPRLQAASTPQAPSSPAPAASADPFADVGMDFT